MRFILIVFLGMFGCTSSKSDSGYECKVTCTICTDLEIDCGATRRTKEDELDP
jgi:hypothetical protein